MATTPFTSSMLNKSPDEKAAVVDAYTKLDDGVLNSYTDLTATTLDQSDKFSFMSKMSSAAALERAKADSSVLGDIGSAFSSGFGKAKSYVSSLAESSKGALATIKGTTNTITGALRGANQIYTTVNGVQTAIKNGNLTNLRNISNTLNAVTGKVGVLLQPQGAMTSIMTAVAGEGMAAGISGSFKTVAESIKDSSDFVNKGQAIYQVASGNLPAAVARGDLSSIASMVDYVGNGSVAMMNPAIIKTISKTNTTAYSKSEIGDGQSSGQFYEYKGAYQKIDPNWNKSGFKENGTDVKDLSCLMDASVQTQDVFITGSRMAPTGSDDKTYSFITGFSKTTVNDAIKANQPNSPAITVTNIYNKNVDPRLYGTEIN